MDKYANAPEFIPNFGSPTTSSTSALAPAFPPYSAYRQATESASSSFHSSYSAPAAYMSNPMASYAHFFAPGLFGDGPFNFASNTPFLPPPIRREQLPGTKTTTTTTAAAAANQKTQPQKPKQAEVTKQTIKNDGNDDEAAEKLNKELVKLQQKKDEEVVPEYDMIDRSPELRIFCAAIRLILKADSDFYKLKTEVLQELETKHHHKTKTININFLQTLLSQNYLRERSNGSSNDPSKVEIGLSPTRAESKFKLLYAKHQLTSQTYDVWEHLRPMLPSDGGKKEKGGLMSLLASPYALDKDRRQAAVKELAQKRFVVEGTVDNGVVCLSLGLVKEKKAITYFDEQLQQQLLLATKKKQEEKEAREKEAREREAKEKKDNEKKQQQQQQQQQRNAPSNNIAAPTKSSGAIAANSSNISNVSSSSMPVIPESFPKKVTVTKDIATSTTNPVQKHFGSYINMKPEARCKGSETEPVVTASASTETNVATTQSQTTNTAAVHLRDAITETEPDAPLPRSRSVFTEHEHEYYQQLNADEEHLEKETMEFSRLVAKTNAKENELRFVKGENCQLDQELELLQKQIEELEQDNGRRIGEMAVVKAEENAMYDLLSENSGTDETDLRIIERVLQIGGRILVSNQRNQESVELTPVDSRRFDFSSFDTSSKTGHNNNTDNPTNFNQNNAKNNNRNNHLLINFDSSQLVTLQALHHFFSANKINLFPIYQEDQDPKTGRFTPNLEYSIATKIKQGNSSEKIKSLSIDWFSTTLNSVYPVSIHEDDDDGEFDPEVFDCSVSVVREKDETNKKSDQPVFYLALDKLRNENITRQGNLEFDV